MTDDRYAAMGLPTEAERRDAWAAEDAIRERTQRTLDEACRLAPDDENIAKTAAQYRRGLLTANEAESKLKEMLP